MSLCLQFLFTLTIIPGLSKPPGAKQGFHSRGVMPMSWNYRVMRRYDDLGIYEVYYNEDGSVKGFSENPVSPRGGSISELKLDMERYMEALSKPILDYEE